MTQSGRMGFQGGTPRVLVQPAVNPEKSKYERLWDMPEYRAVAPGENFAPFFLQQARPPKGSTCIDFGCGTGRGSMMLAALGRLTVTMVDFAPNCLDPELARACETQPWKFKFLEHDLLKPFALDFRASYGYCTDVMEHIPEQHVEQVLHNILDAANKVWFQIATAEDKCGELIGEELHVTVKPASWWLKQFEALECTVFMHKDEENHAFFYVSRWAKLQEFVSLGQQNTAYEEIYANIRANVQSDWDEESGAHRWQQFRPYERQNTEIMLLGGGPSLSDFEDEIAEKRGEGMPLVTMNGTYNWCLERNLTPSAQVVIDARDFNARFLTPVVDDCKYFLASQCHPSLFEGLPPDRTFIFHAGYDANIRQLIDAVYEQWYPVIGGSTVMLRALMLFRMLGYYRFHVYGFDSCLAGENDAFQHHAYHQPENDLEDSRRNIMNVEANGRMFPCYPWMASQAQEFINQVKFLGEHELDMIVYGDGLIANVIQHAANVTEAKEA